MILLIDRVSELTGRLEEARRDLPVVQVGELHAAEQALEGGEVVVAVLGPSIPLDEALDAARKLHEAYPDVSLVLATGSDTPDVYRQAMRAGVADVLPRHAELDEIRDVLDRAIDETGRLRLLGDDSEARQLGTTIATFSTKGGCGKSFLATNLATLLADRYPNEVALIDLDLQAGDAALMLQLLPERSLREAAELGDGLDDEALRGFLTHARGLHVLAAPNHPIHAEEVTPETVVRVLTLLREMFRFVVVDCPPSFTEQMLAAIEHIDLVAVVSSLDVPSIKNLRLTIDTLRELGVSRDRMRLVLNRADSKVGLTIREVEKSLGTTIDVQLPSSREVPFAVNQGVAIVTTRPKSAVARALRDSLPHFDATATRDGRTRGSRRRSDG